MEGKINLFHGRKEYQMFHEWLSDVFF